ncbi:MAG: alpha/beta fold hydrolase [Acidobacteriota bacterium]
MRSFQPLFKNCHLATIAGNFWPRPKSERRWPVRDVFYEPEPGVQLLVRTQTPANPLGELILVHGLEGSSESGYARSMAAAALEAGYTVHRYNMRGCGGSPWHPKANYHSGQTGDLLHVARARKRLSGLPLFAVGYSLGGNIVLKLAGELGEQANELFAGVCSVSTPIDLAVSVEATGKRQNILYRRRFVAKLKDRVRRRNHIAPDLFPLGPLAQVRTIYDFDDLYTARIFGFGTADNYYRTQSSNQFLECIRIPTLLVQAKDDPMVPFAMYRHPGIEGNPNLHLVAVEHGGHLGFLARQGPRFWLDALIVNWLAKQLR